MNNPLKDFGPIWLNFSIGLWIWRYPLKFDKGKDFPPIFLDLVFAWMVFDQYILRYGWVCMVFLPICPPLRMDMHGFFFPFWSFFNYKWRLLALYDFTQQVVYVIEVGRFFVLLLHWVLPPLQKVGFFLLQLRWILLLLFINYFIIKGIGIHLYDIDTTGYIVDL